MKLLISLAMLLSSSTLLAAAPACPKNTKSLYRCESTPQAGDNEIASGVFTGISICTSGSKYLMVVEDQNGPSNAEEVKSEIRMGGSSFSFQAEDVVFSLSVPTGMATKATTAKFSVKFLTPKLAGSSTYTCK